MTEEGMTDDEAKAGLVMALKAEESWSNTYLRAELSDAQINALKRYYGDPYGDEVEGRSQITTREVFETIEWLRPDLRRPFVSGDRIVEFQAVRPEHDQYAEEASDYINHIFLVDNPGEQVLDALIFDGLLHRRGVIACEWKDSEFAASETLTGLNSQQAEQLVGEVQRGRLQIEAQDVTQGPPDAAHPDGVYYEFKVRRLKSEAKAEVFAIAPEDFRIAARAVDLETARYVGDVVRMMAGEAKRLWPGYDEEIDSFKGDTSTFSVDDRRAERFRDVEGWDSTSLGSGKEGEAAEVEILREFIRYDLDGDGYPEMLRCYRIADTLLEVEEVKEHIYASWTPIPIPHRFYGLGVADILGDLQRTKTVLHRGMLDSVYMSVAPRVIAKQGVNLDDLLVVAPGAVVRDDSPPGAIGVTPLVTPDLSESALQAMQWVDRVAEMRTGVTRQSQGMDPDILHDTARGVDLLQNAASVRKEEYARNLAEGLQVFFGKLYRLVVRNQNAARAVKIAGSWSDVDVSTWDEDLKCTVSVGLGTGAREKQIMMLGLLQSDQGLAVQTFGPNNPSVGPMELWNMVREKGRILGMKSVERFFKQPIDPQTGQPWVPPPPQDPNAAKAQAEVQKAQMDMQMRQMEMEAEDQRIRLQAEKDMQVTAAQQRDEMMRADLEAQASVRSAQIEAEKLRLQAEQMRMDHEREMERMRIDAAMKQAELDMKFRELQLKEFELNQRAEIEGRRLEDGQAGVRKG